MPFSSPSIEIPGITEYTAALKLRAHHHIVLILILILLVSEAYSDLKLAFFCSPQILNGHTTASVGATSSNQPATSPLPSLVPYL